MFSSSVNVIFSDETLMKKIRPQGMETQECERLYEKNITFAGNGLLKVFKPKSENKKVFKAE